MLPFLPQQSHNYMLLLPFCFTALYGAIFPKDIPVAMIHLLMWSTVGSVLGFLLSSFLCVLTKVYIVISMVVVAMVTLMITLYLQRNLREHGISEKKLKILNKDGVQEVEVKETEHVQGQRSTLLMAK